MLKLASNLLTKASKGSPLKSVSSAPLVVGKSGEEVFPVINTLPLSSIAMALASSSFPASSPPIKVEASRFSRSVFNLLTKASELVPEGSYFSI